MNGESTVHQVKYIIWIRSEYKPLSSPVFRGTLETIAGQQFEFSTLAELNCLLYETVGWIDKPQFDKEGGKMSKSDQKTSAKGWDNKP